MKKYIVSILSIPIILVLFYVYYTSISTQQSAELSNQLWMEMSQELDDDFRRLDGRTAAFGNRRSDSFQNLAELEQINHFIQEFDSKHKTSSLPDPITIQSFQRLTDRIGKLFDPEITAYYTDMATVAFFTTNTQESYAWLGLKIRCLRELLWHQCFDDLNDAHKNYVDYEISTFITENEQKEITLELRPFSYVKEVNYDLKIGTYQSLNKEVHDLKIPIKELEKTDKRLEITLNNLKTGKVRSYETQLDYQLK